MVSALRPSHTGVPSRYSGSELSSYKFSPLQKLRVQHFPQYKIREILVTEYNRAHRDAKENVKQLMSDYYFPKMTESASEIVLRCRVSSKANYNRHLNKQELGEIPIPIHIGERLI